MTKKQEIYKCKICGNVVEVLHAGKGRLVCCDEPMKLLKENTEDASEEKHVPVIDKKTGEVTIRIGSTPHPMEEKHYIEWVEIIDGDRSCRKFLSPGEAPQAVFKMLGDGQDILAREYCNLHGLWKSR